MGIYLMKRGDGYDPRWHGQWMVDGVRKHVSLNRWAGTPPGPGEVVGDAKFERSRQKAQDKFDKVKNEETSAAEEAVLEQKIYAARYGRKLGRLKLAEVAARWDELPHGTVTAGRTARIHSVIGRFVAWMGAHYPSVKEAGALTAKQFKDFFADVEKSGVTPRTWNDILDILRMVLGKVDGQSAGFRDYLAKLPKKTKAQAAETVHRRPFRADELAAIFRAAREVDPVLMPVIVAAACTALRRGDVARLRWESVDMGKGFVSVKTHKTGETVDIPIFPPFMAVLREAERTKRQGVPYVFPEVANQYAVDPKWLNRHLEKVLKAAGIEATTAEKEEGKNRKNRASLSLWHAFRSSFVTYALSHAVPVQKILAVTGHTNEKTLFQFYDRRTIEQYRDEMRKAFDGAMPLALAGAVANDQEQEGGEAGDAAGGDLEFVGFTPDRAEAARLLSEATEEQVARVVALLKKGGDK